MRRFSFEELRHVYFVGTFQGFLLGRASGRCGGQQVLGIGLAEEALFTASPARR